MPGDITKEDWMRISREMWEIHYRQALIAGVRAETNRALGEELEPVVRELVRRALREETTMTDALIDVIATRIGERMVRNVARFLVSE